MDDLAITIDQHKVTMQGLNNIQKALRPDQVNFSVEIMYVVRKCLPRL